MLLATPPKKTRVAPLLGITASSRPEPRTRLSLRFPPGSKLYCSPTSVLYNTGSICFNPDLYTVNPAFYPWGLWSPPAYLNVPGFVPPFEPGLLIRYCPSCAVSATRRPFGAFVQYQGGLPPDLWTNSKYEVTATAEPPSVSTTSETKVSGPPVLLILKNGTEVLVSHYWLGQDWLLHFVTVTGNREAVALNALDLKSTGAVNYARGVTFVLPGWPEPRAKN